MKNALILGFLGLCLWACSDKADSPIEFLKKTTVNDTYKFCMDVNKSKEYCDCEMDDLLKTFPWKDYMNAIDFLAGEQNHVATVIKKYNGDENKILAELNCDTCYFATALAMIDAKPSPECVKILNK
jgi:hypothetical protein